MKRCSVSLFLVVLWACLHVSWAEEWAHSASKTTRTKWVLQVRTKRSARLFERHTFGVTIPKALQPQRLSEMHDAYDANRDGYRIRLYAVLRHASGASMRVPGFALQKKPGGPWFWEIRWSPQRAGRWQGKIVLERSQKGRQVRLVHRLKSPILVHAARAGIQGPLIAPQKGQNPRYLRVRKANGKSEALWLWGACRAWVVSGQSPPREWLRHEWISRKKTLFPLLRARGYNLLNQWMAPWEFLLIHRDRASHWQDGRSWRRMPYPKGVRWRSYATYDQGRAIAFDRLLAQSEGDTKRTTLYNLLSPIAHQNFQLREHPWGSQESGWSQENDRGKQHPSKLNGFSGVRKKMDVWSFFQATPHAPLRDRRSQLFDVQANAFRYLIARWGYSRALGVWVLIDELDAVGGEVGSLHRKTGWWRHPEASRWLGMMFRMFRGQLKRSDGMRYQGDPFGHPLHAATTSFGGGLTPGANIEWKGPKGAKPDLFGWHWYPNVSGGQDARTVLHHDLPLTIRGLLRYARIPLHRPRLISEFGAAERSAPTQKPNLLYPALYHVGIWTSILAGHAGSVMDWDDGKGFGEIRWKPGSSAFSRQHYGLDLTRRMQALQRFLKLAKPDLLASTMETSSTLRLRLPKPSRATVLGLYTRTKKDRLWGWLFSPGHCPPITIHGMQPGRYTLTWVDPWTGLTLTRHAQEHHTIAPKQPLTLKTIKASSTYKHKKNAPSCANASPRGTNSLSSCHARSSRNPTCDTNSTRDAQADLTRLPAVVGFTSPLRGGRGPQAKVTSFRCHR